MRSEKEPLFKLGPLSNRLMVMWMLATITFTVLVTSIVGAQAVFKTAALGLNDWGLILPLAIASTFWMELRKAVAYR
jgi:hypothetical protein